MKAVISASILSSNPSDYGSAVRNMVESGVDWIHFDVMDGQFVPPITFGSGLVASLRREFSIKFEAHLMTRTPEQHFEAFVGAGCQRVIFHAEATDHAHRLVGSLREAGVEAGVAINPGTSVEAIVPLLDAIDLALVMTVNPGWGGQALVRSCLDKVSCLRSMAPSLQIEVDGGVDGKTIAELWKSGANVFVTGKALAESDNMLETVRILRDACC